ncbi:MAG: DUF1109 domain-containing protein [Alphaproteobacteria bacterium]|nr:DUF1109 domain-containing protein [Alphaproteobacteria bacterium]
MKDTEALIADLSGKITPTRGACAYRLFAGCVAALAVYIALIFATGFRSVRPDIAAALAQPLFDGEIASLILLVLSSVYAAILLGYPDRYQKPRVMRAVTASGAVFILVLAAEALRPGQPMHVSMAGVHCLLCISGLSLLPAALLFVRLRRMATVAPGLAGMLCALCAFAVGALILRLSEPTDNIAHVVVWHYLPMLGISFGGFWLGRRVLKW